MLRYFVLITLFISGCVTQPKPVPLPLPKCEYTVGGKCRTFTADDKQGTTTYGHSDENQLQENTR